MSLRLATIVLGILLVVPAAWFGHEWPGSGQPRWLWGAIVLATIALATCLAGKLAKHRTRLAAAAVVAGAALVLALVELIWRPPVVVAIVSFEVAGQALHIAVPLALAALCGAMTERAGVIDLALEAKLLFGAFAAAAVAHATGSAYLGVAGGLAVGMLVAAVQMMFALRLAADQVIIGVALNLLALGGTRFLLQLFYGDASNSPRSPDFGNAGLGNPLYWIAVIATIVVPLAMLRTRWGLRLRAAGDRPEALVAVGVSPTSARFAAGLVGGALAGAGGAHLSLAVGGFSADMSAGRGYIAIAMVILAGWRPAIAALACAGIGAAYAINIQLQITGGSTVPPEAWRHVKQLLPLLPWVLTLVVLVIAGGKHRPPPRSLGKI
jgi:simple sugar transport system permease protein